MKKFVFAICVLLLCGLGVAVLAMNGSMPELPAKQENAYQDASGVDYAAIYALHDPDEVVMTVGGKDVTWDEYYYYYYSQARDMEETFTMYQYYGYAIGWNTPVREDGSTYGDLVGQEAESGLLQMHALDALAEESGLVLTPEEEAQMMERHQEYIAYFCGENGTEEELWVELKDMYMSEEMYWRYMRYNMIWDAYIRECVGENGEHLTEQEVLDWMDSYNIISIDRIKLAGEPVSEEAEAPAEGEGPEDAEEPQEDAEAPAEGATEEETPELAEPEGEARYELDPAPAEDPAALAQELAARLQAVEDPEARTALFLELKAEYSADELSYVSNQSAIDPTIYEAALALEPGQVSDPIEIGGEYYIILRRPLSAEDSINTGYGTESARSLAMSEVFEKRLVTMQESLRVEYAEGFVPPRILDYYTKPSYAR